MRYDFVERHRDRWPVRTMCRVLRVSPGGYYGWRGRPRSSRATKRDALVVAIKAVHAEVKARYGSPRVHAELAARGKPRCVNTITRRMRREGIAAKAKRDGARPVVDRETDAR
jgi:beta-phosphoglucomutase-like phosphatase (HAD superfamily)